MKDAIIEVVDALGRPSRIMSDIQDASGRRMPDHADLIRMHNELSSIEADPSQYVFNKLVRKYDKEKRDNLLELFFDKKEVATQQDLRDRILKNQFGKGFRKQVMVEKRPFSFLVSKENSLFDSTPGGYILKRLGNVNNTYQKTQEKWGVETKELSDALVHVENYIALSDAKTHEQIKETLEAADSENKLTIALTGDVYNNKISDMKYLQDYSIRYDLLGRNASSIRDYLRRNGRSSSDNVEFMKAKLMRIETIRDYMRAKEDGLLGDMLKSTRLKKKDMKEGMQDLVDHFKPSEINVKGRRPRLYRNMSTGVEYVYSKLPYHKDKWAKGKAIYPKQRYFLNKGKHVIVKNPLRFDPITKEEILDAYSLLMVTGDVTPENIRGFSGGRVDLINFMSKSMILKSRISSLTAETFEISQGHAEGSQNWVLEKGAEDMLV